MFLIPGVVVERRGSRRLILTEEFGPIQTSVEGLFQPILYAGSWSDFARGEKIPRRHWLGISFYLTRKQLQCEMEGRVMWDEERRVPTRLGPPVPCRLLFCTTCGLLLTFKL